MIFADCELAANMKPNCNTDAIPQLSALLRWTVPLFLASANLEDRYSAAPSGHSARSSVRSPITFGIFDSGLATGFRLLGISAAWRCSLSRRWTRRSWLILLVAFAFASAPAANNFSRLAKAIAGVVQCCACHFRLRC